MSYQDHHDVEVLADINAELRTRAEKMEAALRKIAALIDSEAGEPLDEAIWIANEALR